MPNTPNIALPYPAGTDKAGQANTHIQALATALDTRTTAGVTFGSGWSDLSANETTQVDKRAGVTTLYLAANKNAASTANEVICTLPAGFRPRRAIRGVCNNAGSNRPVLIAPTGAVTNDVAQANGLAALVGSVTFVN